MFNYHFESNAIVRSPVNQAFAYIDDHTRLSSHMSESSWKMGGGQMEFVLDEGGGKRLVRKFVWSAESLVLNFRLMC